MAEPSQAHMFLRQLGLTTRLAIYCLLALGLMAADARYDALTLLRSGAAAVIHPLQQLLARPFVFLSDAGGFFVVHGELLRDNQRLEREHQQWRLVLRERNDLAAENARLRALLAMPGRPGTRMEVSEVIRVQPDPFARKLLIDRGSAQGIEAGRPVVDGDGLLGQVTRVYPGSSEVTLLTAREQAAPVQNQRNGLNLIVSGVGSDSLLEIRYLDQHADLKPGDLLFTSGLDGVYPPGIPVARVLRIDPPTHTPFAHAWCQPLAGIGRHRHLAVLSRAPQPPTVSTP